MTADGRNHKYARERAHPRPSDAVWILRNLPPTTSPNSTPPPQNKNKNKNKKTNPPIAQPTNGRRCERSWRAHRETHLHAYSPACSLRERICAGALRHRHGCSPDDCAERLYIGAHAAVCAELVAVRHWRRVRIRGTAARARRCVSNHLATFSPGLLTSAQPRSPKPPTGLPAPSLVRPS